MLDLSPRTQRLIGASFVVALLLAAAYTVKGFFPALAWAAVLSIGLWPIHQRLQQQVSLAGSALLLTGAISLVFIVPIAWVSVQAAADAKPFLLWLNDAAQNGVPVPDWVAQVPFVHAQVATWWQAHLASSGALSQTYAGLRQQQPLQHGQTLALNAAHHVTLIVFTIVTLFFLLQHGATLSARGRALSTTFMGETGETVLLQVTHSIRGTISGLVFVGVGEGILMGIAYFSLACRMPRC